MEALLTKLKKIISIILEHISTRYKQKIRVLRQFIFTRFYQWTPYWGRALCDGFSGHWFLWSVMQTCASFNGFRCVCLMGVGCFRPCNRCLHPWSWSCCLYKAHPWIMCSCRQLVHPWRWCCWGYARFLNFSAVYNFWGGTVNVGFLVAGPWRQCVQLVRVGPLL